MQDRLSFGQWVREYRKVMDLTQEELAERVGCSRDTIRKVELGQRRPSRQVAHLLADIFELTPEERGQFLQLARAELASGSRCDADTSPVQNDTAWYEPSVTLTPAAEMSMCSPYKGLSPFREADAAGFFGREALTSRLAARLFEPSPLARFLAVVGPSGCGKSSLVHAGLVPALRRRGLPEGLIPVVTTMTPGTHPLEELEAALLRVAANPPQSLMEQLTDDNRGLTRVTKRILPDDPGTELLLVIDQFEELLTPAGAEQTRLLFLNNLYSAVTDPRSRFWVVVTLRADFFDTALLQGDLSGLLRERSEFVTPMLPEEMHRAIALQARRAGLTVEPELCAALEAELCKHVSMLPLLQHVLAELFEEREGQLITLASYRSLGGVPGVVGRRAEQIYATLSSAEQQEAHRLLLRLVMLADGAGEDRIRRTLRSELASVARDDGAFERVLDLFGREHLLTFDRDSATGSATVEIAHEGLQKGWPKLSEWVDAARPGLTSLRRLHTAASEWVASGNDPSYLAAGTRLAQLELASERGVLLLTPDEASYLRACTADRERREATQLRGNEHERSLEKRTTRKKSVPSVVLGVVLLVAVFLVAMAISEVETVQSSDARVLADMVYTHALNAARSPRVQPLILAPEAVPLLSQFCPDITLQKP